MNAHDEVDHRWRKSSYSGTGNGDCVDVAYDKAGAAVRDSKNPDSGKLELPSMFWQALTTHISLTV